jgi:transposase-like protein
MNKNWETVIPVAKEMLDKGESLEKVLSYFREQGLSKTYSIRAIIELLNVDLNEAKEIVHNSLAWQDRFDSDEYFQQKLENVVEKLDSKTSIVN